MTKTITQQDNDVSVVELTREEGLALIDQQARRYLGMSGSEFIEAFDSGRYLNEPERPEVVRVAMLLPFAR